LAADPTTMPKSMSRKFQHGPGELELVGVVPKVLGVVEELGAGGVAAGAAVVVGGYHSGSNPTRRMASMASATSASRNQI
jgi:hypothetical protein